MSAVHQVEQEVEELLTIERRSQDGSILARVALDPSIFGVTPHVPVMHQVVTAQLAARRAGTQSTKTRSEVAGGSAKPHRQKGTGRARQGSTRAPHYAGGGVALGPKPRSYKQRTPKKMVQLALRSALSDRAMEGRVILVGEWDFPVPKTREAAAAIRALDLDNRILVVLEHGDVHAERSFDNIPFVDLVESGQLTAYDVLASDWVVFTDATLPGTASVVETFDPPLPPPARESAASSATSAPPANKTAGSADAAAAPATSAEDGDTAAESEGAGESQGVLPSSSGEGDAAADADGELAHAATETDVAEDVLSEDTTDSGDAASGEDEHEAEEEEK